MTAKCLRTDPLDELDADKDEVLVHLYCRCMRDEATQDSSNPSRSWFDGEWIKLTKEELEKKKKEHEGHELFPPAIYSNT